MQESASHHPSRRAVLGRGAVLAAGVWTVPVIQSIANPAAAGSAPPGVVQCLSQTFTGPQGGDLLFASGIDSSFFVNLHATFTDITMIYVRLFQSAADPLDAGDNGSVQFRFPDGSSGGVMFYGGSVPDPLIFGFGPTAGGSVTYHSLLVDGMAEVIVSASSVATGEPRHTFALTKVEVEVCGTLA